MLYVVLSLRVRMLCVRGVLASVFIYFMVVMGGGGGSRRGVCYVILYIFCLIP
jgi:hypothetical protein